MVRTLVGDVGIQSHGVSVLVCRNLKLKFKKLGSSFQVKHGWQSLKVSWS